MNRQIIFFLTVIIFLGLSACNTGGNANYSDEDTTITDIDTNQDIEEGDIQNDAIIPELISEYDEDEMISTLFVEYNGEKTQITKMEGAIGEYDENTSPPMMTDVPETAVQIFYSYWAGLATCYYIMETEVDFIIFEASIWEGEDEQIVEEMWRKEK